MLPAVSLRAGVLPMEEHPLSQGFNTTQLATGYFRSLTPMGLAYIPITWGS